MQPLSLKLLFLVAYCASERRATVRAYEPCSTGSNKGQTTDGDCNPACWPRQIPQYKYCGTYRNGFQWGTWNVIASGGCLSGTGAHGCDCYAHDTDGGCKCVSTTLDQPYCWRSTEACPVVSACEAGQQLNQGCGCNLKSDGTYECTDGQAAGCSNCPAGTFQASAHSIYPCVAYAAVEPGFYIDVAAISNAADFHHNPCEEGWACPGGNYQVASRYICPAGKYSQGQRSACDLCPLGQACITQGSTISSYVACNSQAFTEMHDRTGARLCTDFLDPVTRTGSRNYVYYVAAGFKLAMQAGEWTWAPCESGTYSSAMRMDTNAQNLTTCTSCATGQYISQAGQTACKLCPIGSYRSSTLSSAQACNWCPDGTTSRTFGATSCEPCPIGSYKKYSQLGSWNEDIQPESQYCTDCAAGTYASQIGATACTPASSGFYVPNSHASTQVPCPIAGQTCIQVGTTYTDASGNTHTSFTMEGQCGTKLGDTMPVGQGASWLWKDNNAKRYCGFCPAGKYLNAASQLCLDCPSGYFCTGKDATGPRQCTQWNSSLLGKFWISEPCNKTQDIKLSACRARKDGEFISSECTNTTDRRSITCKTCGINRASPYHEFTNYIVTPCSTYADTECGKCNASDKLVGGICNACPLGTRFENASCVLCKAGSYCNSSSSSVASSASRSLLQAAGRWLLDITASSPQSTGEFTCPAGTVSGPGADADHCLPNCGIGFFSRDATRANCAPVASPSLKRVAWYTSGQDAVAAVQLGSPWNAYYVVARNPSFSNAQAGELLLVGPDNQAYSLAGSPFTAANSVPTPYSAATSGTLTRLGRIYGMAADPLLPVTQLVFTEQIGSSSILRVVNLTGTTSSNNNVAAVVWSAGSAPSAKSKLNRIAPSRTPNGYFFVADELAQCVWWVHIQTQNAQWIPVTLSGSFVLVAPTAVATDLSQDRSIIYLAILDVNVLVTCAISVEDALLSTTGITCAPIWSCGGGIIPTSSTQSPTSCNAMKITSALTMDVALVPNSMGRMAYILTSDSHGTEASGGAQRDGVAIINASATPATLSWAVSLSSPTNFGQGAAFGMLTDFILTTGPTAWGASIQAMGLHGCLCAAGFYCLSGQCVATPAGTYSDDWAMAPTKCPPGSAGDVIGATSLAEACKLCSSDDHMTTYEWGSVNCIPKCNAGNPVYSPTQRTCLAACNNSLGFYREEISAGSSCKPCPPGTQATAGVGIDACIPCSTNTYYAADRKQCLPCPPGTAALAQSSDVCMPSTQSACDDGLLSLSLDVVNNAGCNTSTTSLPATFNADITAMYATPSGVLFISKRDGTIWRWSRKVVAGTPPSPTLVTTYASPSVVIAVTADGQSIYSASKDATCIQWFDVATGTNNVIGNCAYAGALGYVVSIALIERPNFNTLLAVSSRVTWKDVYCHAVLTVSAYNQQIRSLLHYDVTTDPSLLLSECRSDTLLIAAGGGKLYLAWKENIDSFDLDTISEVAQYPNPNQGVSSLATTTTGGLLLAEKLSNNIDLIPAPNSPSLTSVATNISQTILNLVGAGNHIWYTQSGALKEIVLPNHIACAAGFFMVTVNGINVCTQLGHGMYNTDGRSEQRCPPGTYGAIAGAGSKQEGCLPCPIGTISTLEASIACTSCPMGMLASTDGTACLSQCATASYQNTTTSACVACPLGYTTTTPNARSVDECIPCPPGTYVNKLTDGKCAQCPPGQTSLAASHHCAITCSEAENTCSIDGKTCQSASNKYAMLTQIKTQDNPPYAISVQNDGGVFYTDSVSIFYYLDVCPADSLQCTTPSANPIITGGQCITALAIANTANPTSAATSATAVNVIIRYLYYADAIEQTVRRMSVVYTNGILDTTQTNAASSVIIAGKRYVNGAADGPCLEATFNTIMDIEITQSNNGRTIYVLDSYNYKIRRITMQDSTCTTSTILMNGHSSWNDAISVAYKVPLYGFGLSTDETTLYIAFPSQHRILSLDVNSGVLQSICEMQVANYHNDQPSSPTSWCHSYDNNNVRPCMLRNVYDVVGTDPMHIYALFIQGVTQVNFAAQPPYTSYGAQCTQVAGVQNDLFSSQSTGLRDGLVLTTADGITSDTVNNRAAQMNVPYKIAYASSTNIIYIADLRNRAIRRMYVNTDCTCAPGLVYLKSGRTCYNPNPNWDAAPLPACQAGYYALNGETTCAHSCADASATDDANTIAAARACVQALSSSKPQAYSYNFNQILSSTTSHSADWYGYPQYQITTDFNSIPASTTIYHTGAAPGRAPSGGQFATLTWSVFAQEWEIEYDWKLQPTLITSGLWYPCGEAIGSTIRSSYSCASSMFSFEQLSPDKPRYVPGKWESLRISAYEQGGLTLTDSITSLYNVSMGIAVADPTAQINLFSRYYIFGSDSAIPSICTRSDGGPCFTVFRHVNTNDVPVINSPMQDEILNVLPSYVEWAQAGCTRNREVCNASGYVGWPAHYACPSGYMWLGPGLHTATLQDLPTGLSSQIACISCLPGFYSRANALKTDGGPYSCTICEPGSYSSGVASTTCTLCPAGTYNAAQGATSCTRCDNPKWNIAAQTTLWPGSTTVDQCIGCDPGTGSCGVCPAGGYQTDVGQLSCLPAPMGSMSPYPNASSATPCPFRQYTNAVGQTSCKTCNGAHQYTNSDIGATVCATCTNSTCRLTVDNICGKGCGLNRYWNVDSCVTCPPGTLNADYQCADTVEACIATARGDMYLPAGSSTPQQCPLGQVASLDWTYCETCIPGSYSDGSVMIRQFTTGVTANATCHKCPPGTFGNASNMSSCLVCPPGSYTSTSGNTACSPCPQGKYCPTWGTSRPTECSPGTYGPTAGLTRCLLCANNTASSVSGRITQCEPCNADMGYYSPAPGGTTCRNCNGSLEAGNCNPCGLGHYFQSSTRECKSCMDGTVNLLDIWATDISSCQRCSSQTAYAAGTHDSCLEAAPGQIPSADGTSQVPCPPGTYRQGNMSTCAQCSAGSYTNQYGSASCLLCKAGTFMGDMGSTSCTACGVHTYSWTGAMACSVCPPGSEPNASVACQQCKANYYSPNGFSCSPCSPNQYAPAGAPGCSYCPPPFVPGIGFCTVCPPGKISSTTASGGVYSTCDRVNAQGYVCPNAGSTSVYNNCTKCSAPYTPNSNRTQCELCGPGRTVKTSDGMCTACPVGTFTPDGRACLVCPAGTFTASIGTSQCTSCPPGQFRPFSNYSGNATACIPCPVGSYANTTGLTSCIPCTNNGWAGRQGQEQCTPRKLVCQQGQFVNRTTDPTTDNACVICLPCAPGQFTYNTTTRVPSLLAAPSTDILYTASYLCNGDGMSPGYTCLDPTNPKWALGNRLVIDTAGSTADGVGSGNQFASCPDISSIRFLVDYSPTSVCPTMTECYVSCRYGLQPNAVSTYASFLASSLLTFASDRPATNVFLLDNILLLTKSQLLQICSTNCFTGRCVAPGYYRPQVQPAYTDLFLNINMPACGAPCGIAGQCIADNEGCSEKCTNLPGNASFITGAAGVGDSTGCSWACDVGWHLNRDGTACDSCIQENVTSYCGSVNFALKMGSADCTPTKRPADLCVACQRIQNARPPVWVTGVGCQYTCYDGYFFTSNPPTCNPCINDTLIRACPVGTYLNVSTCNTQHVPPVCSNCTTPFTAPEHVQFLSNGGLSSAECRAVCNVGYHTRDINTQQNLAVANWQIGVQVGYLQCTLCTPDDAQTCGTLGCLKGHYRDVNVPENQTGACKTCTTSNQCPTGRYAKPCSGNSTADAACLECPALPYNRQYVPYGIMTSIVTSGDCPSTCINNFVFNPSNGQCEPCVRQSCSMIAPSEGQPSECAYRYSIWNALPTVPWWNVDVMPNRFKQYNENGQLRKNNELWEAAGVCWPCPYGTNVEVGDTNLCTLMDGFGRMGTLPITTTSIPVLTSEMIAVFTKEPRPHLVLPPSRRLLSLPHHRLYTTLTLSQNNTAKKTTALTIATTKQFKAMPKEARRSLLMDETSALVPMACPKGSFKPSRGEDLCQLCPSGRSTANTQSNSVAACQCLPGHMPLVNSSICIPCPADTFFSAENGVCTSCPENQTTWGNIASSRCSCGRGFYRIANTQCAPCPVGLYCETCLDSDALCPSTGVNMFSCFAGSTSPQGSSSLDACVCLNNMDRVLIAPQYYACKTLPFGTRVVQGRIVCKDGWISNGTLTNGDISCILCNPGSYALPSSTLSTQPKIPVTCTPCPFNTFASSSVAVGACTPCPSQQFTSAKGASSINQCQCPDGQTKTNSGTCVGCTSSQYYSNLTRQCMPCPPHTIAPKGATAITHCQCTLGYARTSASSTACDICPTGTYYISPSAPCQPCPTGSTTAGPGSIDRSACGRTSDLCANGYVYRNTGGCYAINV